MSFVPGSFIPGNEFTLKLSRGGSMTLSAIEFFVPKFSQGDPRNQYQKFDYESFYSGVLKEEVPQPLLAAGQYFYYYKDVVFDIQIHDHKKHPLMGVFASQPTLYRTASIGVLRNSKTREECLQIVEDLIQEADTKMTQYMKSADDDDEELDVYIWDHNNFEWDLTASRKRRPLSTVYLDNGEQAALQALQTFLSPETEEIYRKFGIPYKYNMLLHGPPGTGKTTLVTALASELKMDIAILTLTSNMNDSDFMSLLGELNSNTILVLEDVDALFEDRKLGDDQKNGITFSGLLNSTDGLASVHKLVIIMTTNYPKRLDKALMRPGRLDYAYEFQYATPRQIRQVFLKFLPKQEERLDQFLQELKGLDVSTAMLQKFLFAHLEDPNILDHMKELLELIRENTFEKSPDLYT